MSNQDGYCASEARRQLRQMELEQQLDPEKVQAAIAAAGELDEWVARTRRAMRAGQHFPEAIPRLIEDLCRAAV